MEHSIDGVGSGVGHLGAVDAQHVNAQGQDPVGVWGDSLNWGNSYSYVGNSPVVFTDPTGELGWIGAIVGAGVGCLASMGTLYVASYRSENGPSGYAYAGACAGGAVTGALIGATGGVTFIGSSIAARAAAGAGFGLVGLATDTFVWQGGRYLAGHFGIESDCRFDVDAVVDEAPGYVLAGAGAAAFTPLAITAPVAGTLFARTTSLAYGSTLSFLIAPGAMLADYWIADDLDSEEMNSCAA